MSNDECAGISELYREAKQMSDNSLLLWLRTMYRLEAGAATALTEARRTYAEANDSLVALRQEARSRGILPADIRGDSVNDKSFREVFDEERPDSRAHVHQCFESVSPGGTLFRCHGNPNMSPETRRALDTLIDAVTKRIEQEVGVPREWLAGEHS